uniref:Uncharacterized protein n=1 Tax=Ciona intestinalis TaxID=7719 RepID=H2XQU2_CIOIN
MSSYATLLVRRYDDSKSGYYDIKSGFNLRKPTDYPDVQGMNIPDAEPPVDESKDSLFISSITATEEPEVKSSKVVTFSAPPPGVGKFESVLEMQILAQGESPIEAIKITRNQPCDVTSLPDETSGDVITSKPAIRDEIGGCLSETLFQQPEVRRDTSIRGDVIIEDVVAAVSRNNEQDNDDDE